MKRDAWILAVFVSSIGCPSPVLNSVTKTDGTGPQGEPIFEVQCAELMGCMTEARRQCGGGNFGIVTSGHGLSQGYSALLVSCKLPPDAGPVTRAIPQSVREQGGSQ
jgi:hypothetical protein